MLVSIDKDPCGRFVKFYGEVVWLEVVSNLVKLFMIKVEIFLMIVEKHEFDFFVYSENSIDRTFHPSNSIDRTFPFTQIN